MIGLFAVGMLGIFGLMNSSQVFSRNSGISLKEISTIISVQAEDPDDEKNKECSKTCDDGIKYKWTECSWGIEDCTPTIEPACWSVYIKYDKWGVIYLILKFS